MSLDITKPTEVADLFVGLCGRLRALGATRVEAFGCSASFTPPERPLPAAPARQSDPEPDEPLSPEGKDLQARARHLAEGRPL